MTSRLVPIASCAFFAASALVIAGCPAPLAREARAQDAAQELNTQARFGRLSVAIENVAPEEREAYTKRHQGWGGPVRVSDSEMAGMKMKGPEDAEFAVRIAWFRPAEQELRITTIRQKWHDFKGAWQLVSEERTDGDFGLLADDAPVTEKTGAPAKPKGKAQFPTVRIGESSNE